MSGNPLVSFMLLAYKQEQFVQEAVRSALAQTYEPMEIILSDDCSPDRTFELIEKEVATYRGPHQIVLNRNQANLGLARHLNRVWELSHGEFAVAAAGDDISCPHRTCRLVERWLAGNRSPDLVCSYFAEIDVNSKPTGLVVKDVVFVPDTTRDVLQWSCGATGACAGYSRKLQEKFGPLDPHVVSEDWVYSFRAWLGSGIALIEEPLVLHRTHDQSISVAHGAKNNTEPDRMLRLSRRRRMAENQLGIARDWLRAWQVLKKDTHTQRDLERLVRLRELRLNAFDSTRLEAVEAALLTCAHRGGVTNAAKLFVRHALRWY